MKPRLLVPCLLLLSLPAQAGMPTVRLTELASQRLEALSFFGLVFLLCALGLQQLWNRATPWPRLSYARAVGLTLLWGLLFHLVLTMISGARELMTPGAWVKQGSTYRLPGTITDAADAPTESARRADLANLRDALWEYAEEHGGELPPSDFDPALPEALWASLAPDGAHYIYLPGRTVGRQQRVVAYEPAWFGERRQVLTSDGELSDHSPAWIEQELRQ